MTDRDVGRPCIALTGAVFALCVAGCAMGQGRAVPPAQATPTAAASLVLEAVVKSDAGPVLAAVFADKDSYANETPLKTLRLKVSEGVGSATIEGLAPGAYAVKAFQDLDGDGVLDVNAFGIPTEPVAFSNGARIRFGPPGWEAARIHAPPGESVARLVFGGREP